MSSMAPSSGGLGVVDPSYFFAPGDRALLLALLDVSLRSLPSVNVMSTVDIPRDRPFREYKDVYLSR